jgi:hydrogenase expression/formation protein HypD
LQDPDVGLCHAVGFIDEALPGAGKKLYITTFGDLVRVPGGGLPAETRAEAPESLVVTVPRMCPFAIEHSDEEVVFLSVGFETTSPSSCMR